MGDLSQFKDLPEGYRPQKGDEVLAFVTVSCANGPKVWLDCGDFETANIPSKSIIAIREREIRRNKIVEIQGMIGHWRVVVQNPHDKKWWVEATDDPDLGYWHEEMMLKVIS